MVGTISDPVAKRGSYKLKARTGHGPPRLPHPKHTPSSSTDKRAVAHLTDEGTGQRAVPSCRVPSPAAEPRLGHCASLDTKPAHKWKGIYCRVSDKGAAALSNLSENEIKNCKVHLGF